MHISTLPAELLIQILCWLSTSDIVRCTEINHLFHEIVRASFGQYHAHLVSTDISETGERLSGYNGPQRLGLLMARQAAWKRQEPELCRTSQVIFMNGVPWQFKFNNGVFAFEDYSPRFANVDGRLLVIHDTRQLSGLPSTRSFLLPGALPRPDRTLWTLDASQDLVVVFHRRMKRLDIHLISITTGSAHPSAACPTLNVSGDCIEEPCIAGDLVAFVSLDYTHLNMRICFLNWRTGFYRMTNALDDWGVVDPRPSCVLLSASLLLYTTSMRTHYGLVFCLHLCEIEGDAFRMHPISVIHMPALNLDRRFELSLHCSAIRSKSSTGHGGRLDSESSTQTPHFEPKRTPSIIIINVLCLNFDNPNVDGQERFYFIVSASFFASLQQQQQQQPRHLGSSLAATESPGFPSVLDWERWGPQHTLWTRNTFRVLHPLNSFIYGHRVLRLPHIFDFNQWDDHRQMSMPFTEPVSEVGHPPHEMEPIMPDSLMNTDASGFFLADLGTPQLSYRVARIAESVLFPVQPSAGASDLGRAFLPPFARMDERLYAMVYTSEATEIREFSLRLNNLDEG